MKKVIGISKDKMSKTRRKGSSTRKYKSPCPIPEKTKKVQNPQPILDKDLQKLDAIRRLEILIRGGKNKKGKNLTNNEINTFLTTMARLEHELGIEHE